MARVGTSRMPPPLRQIGARSQELADRRAALVLVGLGRHPNPRVVGEQGDDRVDVAALERLAEAVEQLPLGGRVRQRPRLRSLLDRRAGALQRAVHRRLAGVEHPRDLGRPKAQNVAQHEYGALVGRHALQPGNERERHGLLGLVAHLGAVGAVGHALEQGVGVGLEPDRLAPARGLRRVGRAVSAQHVLGPPGAVAQRVQAAVAGYPVQPRAQRGALLEVGQPAPGGQQRLLHHVLGVLDRAEDAVAVHLQLAPVRVGQLAERLLVALAGAVQGGLGHGSILARGTCR